MKRIVLISFSLSSIIRLTGCCANVQCDCATPSVALRYKNDSIACEDLQGLTDVSSYDSENGQVISQDVGVNRFGCTISIPFAENRFWVVKADSLAISDTVRVKNISFKDNNDDCCNCPAAINTIEVDINGMVFTDKEIELRY